MKRTIQTVLLFLVVAGIATGGQVLVDFSIFGVPTVVNPSLLGPQNITTTPTTTRLTAASGVSFQYVVDPNALDLSIPGNLGECAFDAGMGGLQWTPGCVGAHVDSGGVYGTTDGSYVLGFQSSWADQLQFNFMISTVISPTPLSTEFNLQGLFYAAGTNNGAIALTDLDMTCAGGTCSGAFNYTGPAFNMALLSFYPAGVAIVDPNTGLVTGGTFGQTILSMDTVSYDEVPEPGTFALWGVALLGLGVARKLIGRKS